MWSDRRLLELLSIEHPIIQAPMAGAMDARLVIAACEGGALGSLPCAMLSIETMRSEVATIRQHTDRPFNLNFFCHEPLAADPGAMAAWRTALAPYYKEAGLDPAMPLAAASRAPFSAEACALVEEIRPKAVSFHFGLPDETLLARIKAVGSVVMGCATNVAEARWLEERGADIIIAQGAEAGGHRGMFLSHDPAGQVGTFALVPQVVDAVRAPVVAAGGIADGRGIAAAFALGASGVQVGTAYLKTPEAAIGAPFRAALSEARDDSTRITNVMTGKPARGILNRIMREKGPMVRDLPAFPHPSAVVAPLRAHFEGRGSGDFTPLWAGQAAALGTGMPAADFTRMLASSALHRLSQMCP